MIDAKVAGQEIATPAPAAEGPNIVDLMKLLEASVRAATDAKTRGSAEPVSVAEVKKERAARSSRAKAEAASAESEPAPARARKPTPAADSEEAEARPVRRRKSA